MKRRQEHSVENISKEIQVDLGEYGQPVSDANVQTAASALERNGMRVIVVDKAEDALATLRTVIPDGAEVYNGSSTTLAEIGFVDFLKSGTHGWNNRHDRVMAEKEWPKQAELRRLATTSEYFVSSAQAITENGEIVGCDNSGSRVGAWLFAAKNVVIVAGSNKIVPDLDSAMKRLFDYALPLENVRAQKVYGMGSNVSKVAVIRRELGPRTSVILVKEALGY